MQINDGGVVRTVHLAAPNVGGLLAAAGAPLEQSDTVVPAASAPVIEGMQIQVTRIRIEKVTERVPLPPNSAADRGPDDEHEPSGRGRPRNAGRSGRNVCRREGQRCGDRAGCQ